MSLHLRTSARAIIVDADDQVLLCRFVPPHPAVPGGVPAVWAAPGGGVEAGEDGPAALRRELREETGLVVAAEPPHVWRQVVVAAGLAHGLDGMVNDPERLTRLTHTQYMREAGSEGIEMVMWLVMRGAVGNKVREAFRFYHVPTSNTASGLLCLDVL